jgi:GNAT superfamily N-acetyltransferase
MTSLPYQIKTMGRHELDLALDWAAAEGWNPGIHDGDCFYAADPEGFFVGMLGDEAIASISVVKYDDSFGFLGFYIVKPEFRGRGYGFQLWQAGLAYLQGCNIGLDGVVAQQDNYLKSGFQLAYRNIRYQGVSPDSVAAPLPAEIVPLSALPIAAVIQYDRPFFPADRTAFLTSWLAQPGSHSLGVMADGELAGYGVIRRCREGFKIGPLFADDPDWAAALFHTLIAPVPSGQVFYLDVPEVNGAAIALAEGHGMTRVFETARMYTQTPPALPLDRIFGVTTFELG